MHHKKNPTAPIAKTAAITPSAIQQDESLNHPLNDLLDIAELINPHTNQTTAVSINQTALNATANCFFFKFFKFPKLIFLPINSSPQIPLLYSIYSVIFGYMYISPTNSRGISSKIPTFAYVLIHNLTIFTYPHFPMY
jgi:hypothetical protein